MGRDSRYGVECSGDQKIVGDSDLRVKDGWKLGRNRAAVKSEPSHEIADAISGTNHGRLVQTVGQAEARSKVLPFGLDPGIERNIAESGDQKRVCGWIVIRSAFGELRMSGRVYFVAQPQIQCQLGRGLPGVLEEAEELRHSVGRCRIHKGAASQIGVTQNKRREGVPKGAERSEGRTAGKRRNAGIKVKPSAFAEKDWAGRGPALDESASSVHAPFQLVRPGNFRPTVN